MEALSCLIDRAATEDFISGYHIGGRNGDGQIISHLLYADDTLVICQADPNQLEYFSWLLM